MPEAGSCAALTGLRPLRGVRRAVAPASGGAQAATWLLRATAFPTLELKRVAVTSRWQAELQLPPPPTFCAPQWPTMPAPLPLQTPPLPRHRPLGTTPRVRDSQAEPAATYTLHRGCTTLLRCAEALACAAGGEGGAGGHGSTVRGSSRRRCGHAPVSRFLSSSISTAVVRPVQAHFVISIQQHGHLH